MKAAVIHGNKSQGARNRALADFKAGRVTALVATDIAARGLDIVQLPLVVNYDLPLVAEDYIHRVGRTGRAGLTGRAISLVSSADRTLLRDIQRLLPTPLEQVVVEGFDVQPLQLNGNGAPGNDAPGRRQPRGPQRPQRGGFKPRRSVSSPFPACRRRQRTPVRHVHVKNAARPSRQTAMLRFSCTATYAAAVSAVSDRSDCTRPEIDVDVDAETRVRFSTHVRKRHPPQPPRVGILAERERKSARGAAVELYGRRTRAPDP